MSKNSLIKYIRKYDLELLMLKNVKLEETCMQYRPESLFYDLMRDKNGIIDLTMKNSPHREFAFLYYRKGLKWLTKNFKNTKYCQFKSKILNRDINVPMRKIRLFDSLKKGYLSKGFEKDYIVLLERPLVETRYGVKCSEYSCPEVFMGHHRIGALLSCGVKKADVIIARDIASDSRQCFGKIHNIYKLLSNNESVN
jgi:hypothetical protein